MGVGDSLLRDNVTGRRHDGRTRKIHKAMARESIGRWWQDGTERAATVNLTSAWTGVSNILAATGLHDGCEMI